MGLRNYFRNRRERRRLGGRHERWPLSMPLLKLGRRDDFLLQDAVAGVCVFGGTGSSKTTLTGAMLAKSYLSAGMGGLILTAKSDEIERWIQYAKETNRLDDLILLGPGQSGHCFNFLDNVLKWGTGSQIENIASVLAEVTECADRGMGGSGGDGGGENASFFRRSSQQFCKHEILILTLATGTIRIPDLVRLIMSTPTSLEQLRSPAFQQSSYFWQCVKEAERRAQTPVERRDLVLATDYIFHEFIAMAGRTRAAIVTTLTSTLDVLLHGEIPDLLCGQTTVTPDDCGDGKLILMTTTTKSWGYTGLIIQQILKLSFMKAMERRVVDENTRPVLLWADEAHNFLLPRADLNFQTACRSSRVATVLISQNRPNFLSVLANGERGKAEADSILSCLSTHIYHCNSCSETNAWAAERIGRTYRYLMNTNRSYDPDEAVRALTGLGESRTSVGMSQSLQFEVEPQEFTRLSPGGPRHGWVAEAIVHRSGTLFRSTGRNWMKIRVGRT